MKKTLFVLISLFFALSMNAQTLMQVKQEGGYTNIRSGRGTNYRIVTKYKDGSNIYVGPNQSGWRAVYSSANGGFIGYISASKVVDGYGEKQTTSWIPVVCFGKTADNCSKFLKKGSKVGIVGRIQTGSYEKDGKKVYTTDVIANSVEFLSSKTEPQGFTSLTNDDVPF